MDCHVGSAHGGVPGELVFGAELPRQQRPADASRCMNCPVRGQCIGGVAAQAGSRQLLSVVAGRALLRAGEDLHQPASSLSVVRSGVLRSTAFICDAPGLHFPGQSVGSGRALHLVALEDTELCIMLPGAGFTPEADGRAFHGRLWDMMSRELLRDCALANLRTSRG